MNEKAEKLKNEGNEHFKKGKYNEAIQSYRVAYALKPTDITLHSQIVTNMATCFYLQGEYHQGIEYLTNLVYPDIGANPKYIKGIWRIAQCYNATSQWSKAIEFAKQGLEIEPNNEHLQKELAYARQYFVEQEKKPLNSRKDFLEKLKLSKEVETFLNKTKLTQDFPDKVSEFLNLSNFKDLHKKFDKIEKLFEIWKFRPVTRPFLIPLLNRFALDSILTLKMIEKLGLQYIMADYIDELKDDELLGQALDLCNFFTAHGGENCRLPFAEIMVEKWIKIVVGKHLPVCKKHAISLIEHSIHFKPVQDRVLSSTNLSKFIDELIDYFEKISDDHHIISLLIRLYHKNAPICLDNAIWKLFRHPSFEARDMAHQGIFKWIASNHIAYNKKTFAHDFFEEVKKLTNNDYGMLLSYGKDKSDILNTISCTMELTKYIKELFTRLVSKPNYKDDQYVKNDYIEAGKFFVQQIKKCEILPLSGSVDCSTTMVPFKQFIEAVENTIPYLQKGGYEKEYMIIQAKILMTKGNYEACYYHSKKALSKFPNEIYFLYTSITGDYLRDDVSAKSYSETLENLKNHSNYLSHGYISQNICFRLAELTFALYNTTRDKKYLKESIAYFEKYLDITPDDKYRKGDYLSNYIDLRMLMEGPEFTMDKFKEIHAKFKPIDFWNEKFWGNSPANYHRHFVDYVQQKITFLRKCDENYKLHPVKEFHVCGSGCSHNIKDGLKSCNFCHNRSAKLKACGRCGLVNYCGKECQLKDWEKHKIDCKKK